MPVSKFLFGAGFENEIRLGFPLYDILTDREDGEGSEYIDCPDGSIDTWRQNKMFTMQAEARWIPDGPGLNPVQTQLSGPVSWEEFLNWARDGQAFRFVPDETVPDFYVDNTYLVEPRKGFGSLSPDIKRNVQLKLRNPAKSFHEAMRGIMFEYAPGTSLTDPNVATFSRGSAATRRGLPGNLTSPIGASDAVNVLRDRHYEGALKTALLEAQRVQLVTQPENMAHADWAVGGTITRTGGQADPFGGTNAYLLDSNGPSQFDQLLGTLTYTGNGEKCGGVFMRAGTSTQSRLLLYDVTAAAERHSVPVNWSGGVPTLGTSTGTNIGTRFPIVAMGGGWYFIAISALGVIAANTNKLLVAPDFAGGGGTCYFFGANAWDATFPSSYQGPSLGTRNADAFSWPFPYRPQAMAVYTKFVERGTVLAAPQGVLRVGDAANANNNAFGMSSHSSLKYRADVGNVTPNTRVASTAPAFGDTVELLMLVYGDGSVELIQSINGAAATTTGRSAALAEGLAAAWSLPTLWVDALGTVFPGFNAFARIKIGPLTFGSSTRDTIAKAIAA